MPDTILTTIIPCRDARRYLRTCVTSVLRERIHRSEIIVVDDGSIDSGIDTISDLPVRVVRLARSLGIAGAMNAGVEAAQGSVLTFLDSDDVVVPGGLRWRLDWLSRHPASLAVCGRPGAVIDTDGNRLGSYGRWFDQSFPTTPCLLTRTLVDSGKGFPGLLWLFAFRRELVQQLGPFDTGLAFAFDNEYVLRLLTTTDVAFIPRAVALHRLHRRNHSGKKIGRQFLPDERAAAEGLWLHLANGRPIEGLN